MNNQQTLSLQILDKSYKIKCATDSIQDLRRAASYLDTKMRETLESGKLTGNERVAIMTALNISYDLIQLRQQNEDYIMNMSKRIAELETKITQALSQSSQIEL